MKLPHTIVFIFNFNKPILAENYYLHCPETVSKDSLSHWTKKNKIGFDISEIAFINWNGMRYQFYSGLKVNFPEYTTTTITTGQMN
jgi:hypothetical protein